jgi:murein DD-endopeptidase MepM/ murein hydrolase activator NlpD
MADHESSAHPSYPRRRSTRAVAIRLMAVGLLAVLQLVASPHDAGASHEERSPFPSMRLPWRSTEQWFLTQGPHDWGPQPVQPENSALDTDSGLDFGTSPALTANTVISMFDGWVSFQGYELCNDKGDQDVTNDVYNSVVRVEAADDSGVSVDYLHLNFDYETVSARTYVRQGDLIGHTGNVGCSRGEHLHVELYKDGRHVSWVGHSFPVQPSPTFPNGTFTVTDCIPTGSCPYGINIGSTNFVRPTTTSVYLFASLVDPLGVGGITGEPVHPRRPLHVLIAGNGIVGRYDVLARYMPGTDGDYQAWLDLGSGWPSGVYDTEVRLDYTFANHGVGGFITNRRENIGIGVNVGVGDVNEDEKLNVEDFNILVGCLGETPPSCDSSSRRASDLTDNGLVDTFDYNLFLRAIQNQPVANAGSDQKVASGSGFTLDGRGSSDPHGFPIGYRWTQIGGPAVTIHDRYGSPGQPFLYGTAAGDGITGPATLTFRLTVTNFYGNPGTDDVTVTVKAPGAK